MLVFTDLRSSWNRCGVVCCLVVMRPCRRHDGLAAVTQAVPLVPPRPSTGCDVDAPPAEARLARRQPPPPWSGRRSTWRTDDMTCQTRWSESRAARSTYNVVALRCISTAWGEVTSQNLWSRYDRHFVGITRHNVWNERVKIYHVIRI